VTATKSGAVEHVEDHPPPGKCRLDRDIEGFLPRYPSFVNLVAVTFSASRLAALDCALSRPARGAYNG